MLGFPSPAGLARQQKEDSASPRASSHAVSGPASGKPAGPRGRLRQSRATWRAPGLSAASTTSESQLPVAPCTGAGRDSRLALAVETGCLPELSTMVPSSAPKWAAGAIGPTRRTRICAQRQSSGSCSSAHAATADCIPKQRGDRQIEQQRCLVSGARRWAQVMLGRCLAAHAWPCRAAIGRCACPPPLAPTDGPTLCLPAPALEDDPVQGTRRARRGMTSRANRSEPPPIAMGASASKLRMPRTGWENRVVAP